MNTTDSSQNGMCEARRRYGDIIDMPHHDPVGRQRMSVAMRAAQFAPFAALTGHSEAIEETRRYTEEKVEHSADNADDFYADIERDV